MNLVICPRCYESSCVVYCALCGDRREIPETLSSMYLENIDSNKLDDVIKLKRDFFGYEKTKTIF